MNSLMNTLRLVQEIAKLVRVNLPLEATLRELAGKTTSPLRHAAEELAQNLAQGKALRDALTTKDLPASKMLAAAIDIGGASGRLDASLESWAQFVLSRHCHRCGLATALVYPMALTLIAACSLVFCVYTLIPHYEEAFRLLTDLRPAWISWLTWIREYLPLLTVVVVLAMMLPLCAAIFRRWQNNRWGLPKDRVVRFYAQAHTARLASLGLISGQPVSDLLTTLSNGVRSDSATPTFVKQKHTSELLGPETSAILASVQTNSLPSADAPALLDTLATQLQLSGDFASQRDARWIPMLVSLTVGVVVAISYVVLIYLPWVILFCYISAPKLS